MNKKPDLESQVNHSAQSGLFAMTAMMAICCVGVFVLVALIPVIGWPAGATVAIGLGAAVMYAHLKMMDHGPHR